MYITLGGQNVSFSKKNSLFAEQKVYYQKVGKGKDLILIHGWGADVSTFWPIIDFLKDSFILWLIDLPGFGRSQLPKKQFTISDFAKTIAEFIKKNDIKKPTILGHSYGGKVAIKLANVYPNLIDKLILEGSSGISPKKSFLQILIYPFVKVAHFLMPDIMGARSKMRTKLYKKLESDYADAGNMKSIFLNTLKEDLTAELPTIKTETLLIWGEKDRAVPLKFGKKMYRLIEKSKIAIIEDSGHFPHVENPERFSYYVKDFV